MKHIILGMLKGKTIVLPCHALSHLSHADWIICLEQGRIVEQGTFRGLLAAGGDFTHLMDEHASVTDVAEPESEGPADDEPEEETQAKDEGLGANGGEPQHCRHAPGTTVSQLPRPCSVSTEDIVSPLAS